MRNAAIHLPLLLLIAKIFLISPLYAQPVIGFQQVAAGFDKPVDIAHAGDPRLFIVEQEGLIRILNPDGQINTTPFLDIRGRTNDGRTEQGLLGLAFHPDYASNGYFFVNYTKGDDATRISRFSVSSSDANLADPNSELVLLDIAQPFRNHNAGDMAFGPDGYLYIPTGDGGLGGDPGNRAQNGQSLLGKILRLDIDGGTPYSIPADNPFVNDTTILNEIWALGLRNPWRLSFDRLTQDVWIGDVGQDDFEEITRQPAGSQGGENYGWRCYEGYSGFNTGGCGPSANYTFPVYSYTNITDTGKSVTGGFVYRGSQHPNMYGYYIFGDYESGHVWTISADSTEGFPVSYQPQATYRAFSTFGEDSQGELFAADHKRGILFRVTDLTTSAEPVLGHGLLEVFPNPAGEALQIRFRDPQNKSFTVRLIDLSGKVVRSSSSGPNPSAQLERGDLPPGVYILEVEASGRYRSRVIFK